MSTTDSFNYDTLPLADNILKLIELAQDADDGHPPHRPIVVSPSAVEDCENQEDIVVAMEGGNAGSILLHDLFWSEGILGGRNG